MVNSISGGSGAFQSLGPADATRNLPATEPGRVKRANIAPANIPPSGRPSRLESIAADLAARPPVDQPRVDALRLAVAAGTYRPDPARIADAMIAQESAGLTPTR